MSVGSICCREVHVAGVGESALSVARRMRSNRVGSVVVLNEERRPVGIVTDRDLVVNVMAEGLDPSRTPVMRAMTVAPHTVSEETPIETALAAMRSGRFRRLPVVGADGALVGVVALDDVLELLAEEFEDIGRLVAEETPLPC